VKDIILNSVDRISALDGLCVTGGRLNLYNAVLDATKNEQILGKIDNVNDGNSVLPGNSITYTISYANPLTGLLTDVNIVDYLPVEVNYCSSDPCGIYNPYTRTVAWNIGTLSPGEPNSIQLTVTVNLLAEPLGTITNLCVFEANEIRPVIATEITDVNSWNPGVIYVDDDAVGSNTGMSWANAYRDLQDALERAAAGCGSEIWVAAGTYRPSKRMNPSSPSSATFQLSGGVKLFGHFGGVSTYETCINQRNFANIANETILDGQIGQNYWDAVKYVVSADGIEDTVVDGFTIRGGYSDNGAGVFFNDANVAIINCKLKENYNGIDITNYSHPYIHNCLFTDNSFYGINCSYSEPVITNSTFDGNNITPHAIHAVSWSDVKLADCTVKNHTDNAIYGYYYTDVEMHRSVIERNSHTGLACLCYSTLNLTNSVIRFNANCGIYLENISSATIKNNWIHNNAGDYGYGIYFTGQSGQLLIGNTTIVENPLYGIYSDSSTEPDIVNSILYYNGTQIGTNNGPLQNVRYSCVQGGYEGTGNKSDDPNFFMYSTDPNDFHINGSPCKNAGDPDFVPDSGETDIDDEGRVKYGRVDIGADEYYRSRADFDGNDIVNFIDYAIFANAWQSNDPSFSLDSDNDVDYNDLALFCEDWLWQAGWTKTFICGAGQGMIQTMASGFGVAETAYPSVLAEQQIEKVEPLKIEQMIKWLEELWLDEETRKVIDEDIWLKFIESLKEDLQSSLTR